MLKEMQGGADPGRRWFHDDYFDLILWYGEGRAIAEAQLCYDIGRNERVLTWTTGSRASHFGIDSGEESPLKNRSPLLVPDGEIPFEELLRKFRERGAELDKDIRDLVERRLTEGTLRRPHGS
jgi:hypothetical protein